MLVWIGDSFMTPRPANDLLLTRRSVLQRVSWAFAAAALPPVSEAAVPGPASRLRRQPGYRAPGSRSAMSWCGSVPT